MQITEIFIELPVFRTRIISGYFPICTFRLPDGSHMFYGKNKRISNPLFHSRNIFHHPGWTLGTNSNWIRIFKDESVSPKH